MEKRSCTEDGRIKLNGNGCRHEKDKEALS